jgi:hypothetical protein
MTGLDLPRFYSRKKRGELLPITPYTHFKVNGSAAGDLSSNTNGSPNIAYSYSNGRVWHDDWQLTEAELLTKAESYDFQPFVTQAAASIYSQGHDTLTFVAELHKSIELFTGLKHRIAKLIYDPKTALDIFDDAAKSWLEYRYGWRLLYYDIVEVSKVIATLDEKRQRFSQRSGNTFESSTSVTLEDRWSSLHLDHLIETTFSTSVRGAVVADIQPPKLAFDPLTTAWELAPFSFIIDWMVGIGDFLSSMNFLEIATNHFAAGSYRITASRDMSISYSQFQGSTTGSVYLGGNSAATYSLRSPTSVPLRPRVNVNLDVSKVLDLTAILRDLLKDQRIYSLRN